MPRRVLAFALPLVLLAAACGDDDGGPTLETPRAEGTYRLATFGGQQPPVVAFQSSERTGADSTDQASVDTGTWQTGAARVNFLSSDGTSYFARWSGTTLTFVPGERAYVFEKQ